MKLQAFFNSFVDSASDNVSLLVYAAVTCVVCAIVQRLCRAKGCNKRLSLLPFIVGVLLAALDAVFGNLVHSMVAVLNVVADGLTIGAVATAAFGVKQNVSSDATNGVDVRNGTNTMNGTNAANGMNSANVANAKNANATNGADTTVGTNGIDGRNGTNGNDGVVSTVGADGKHDVIGADGANTANGTNAKNANATNGSDGMNGAHSANAANSAFGANGANATNGTDCAVGTSGGNTTNGKNAANSATCAVGSNATDSKNGTNAANSTDAVYGTGGAVGEQAKFGSIAVDAERLARLIRRLADVCSGDTDAVSATLADVMTSVQGVCAAADDATKHNRLTELLHDALGEDAADVAELLLSVLSG